MEYKTYSCAECANRCSPLCELCSKITTPGGKEKRPKHFVRGDVHGIEGMIERSRTYGDAEATRALAWFIRHTTDEDCLRAIPLALVIEYNAALERLDKHT